MTVESVGQGLTSIVTVTRIAAREGPTEVGRIRNRSLRALGA